MTVKDRIKSLESELGNKPYFLPVWTGACPIWKHNAILVGFDSIPEVGSWKYNCPWNRNKTLLMVESGGLMASGRPDDELLCLDRQTRAYPDLVFTLDYPVKVLRSDRGRTSEKQYVLVRRPEAEKRRAIDKTIENAKIAIENKDRFVSKLEHELDIMAIIQGYNLPSLVYCTEELLSLGYDYFALGAITTGAAKRGSETDLLDRLITITDILGKNCWLHLLGITDAKLLVKFKGLYTSFDSATCSIRAKNALLFRPDGGSCHIGRDLTKYSETSSRYLGFTNDEKEFIDFIKLKHIDTTKFTANTEWYFKLQELNLHNLIKHLKKVLWN